MFEKAQRQKINDKGNPLWPQNKQNTFLKFYQQLSLTHQTIPDVGVKNRALNVDKHCTLNELG